MSGAPVLRNQTYSDRTRQTHRTAIQSYHVPNADGSPDPYEARDNAIKTAIGVWLFTAYPGHFWKIEANSAQGIAWITIDLLLGNWKYVFKLDKEITREMVIEAGGEILERFNIPRSGLRIEDFLTARPLAVSRASQTPPGGINKKVF